MTLARTFAVTVAARTEVADVVVLELTADADDRAGVLPPWDPGAHIDVMMPEGLVRQYSLCGPVDADHWRIAVLREADGRGGSRWLADHAQPGTTLQVSEPRNHFSFDAASRPVVLLAAGIGITPIAAMAAAAAIAETPYRLHYCGAQLSRMALIEELVQHHGDLMDLHVSADGNRLDLDAVVADAASAGAIVYACGPARFLDAVSGAGIRHQVDVRMEHFTPVEVSSDAVNTGFEVELAMSGITVDVPADQSILAAVEEQGVLVLSSCAEGTCGTCETPVLDGEIDHRDSILTPAERARNDVMYICVSRAACPRLVLDL